MRTFALLVFVAVLLAITNPRPEQFREFVREQSEALITQQTGGGILGRFLGDLGSTLAASNVDRVTSRKNYYFWSIYTVDLDGPSNTENDWRFLAIATQMVELQRPAMLSNDQP